MRKIKFEKKEDSRANTVWLLIEYMGGDADTEHFEEVKLPFTYSDWNTEENIAIIKEDFDKYMIIKKLTDGSGGTQNHNYDDLVEKYGEEIANMYDDVPNDPQSDFQFKTYLRDVTLIGYDEVCNKFKSYL